MSITRRIETLEAIVQRLATGAVLIREPSEDDGNEAKRTFESELDQAVEAGHQVVVHTAGKYPRQRIADVTYTSDAFAALCALLAHTPATDGRSKDKLCQIVAEVQGRALPVVCEVRHAAL